VYDLLLKVDGLTSSSILQGLQVCGALAPVVKQGHLDIFMRTPSYILPEQAPLAFTPEQKKMLNDRAYFWKVTTFYIFLIPFNVSLAALA
jgi:hypothetical protein